MNWPSMAIETPMSSARRMPGEVSERHSDLGAAFSASRIVAISPSAASDER